MASKDLEFVIPLRLEINHWSWETSQLLQKDALLRIANQAAQQAVETAMAFGLSEADFSSQLGLVHLLCSMNSDANNTKNAQIPCSLQLYTE